MNTKDRYEINFFSKAIAKSYSYNDACRNLELATNYGNTKTIIRYVKKYKLDVSHFGSVNPKTNKIFNNKRPTNEILVENSTYASTNNLKHRLYKEGLKERCCELCGQGEEWMGKKMSLILDHINGVNDDNRIENLRIVCPNCNATLDTHGGKNKKK
jgi:hypothetical protein